MYCTCKSRKKCITNKFIEEINNSSPPIWSASVLHNTGKPLKYMHTPCLYHQIKRDSVEILDGTDQNNSRSSDSLLYDVFLLQTSGDILQLHFLFVKLMNCYCHSIISPQLLQPPAVSPRTGSRALWPRGTRPRAAGLPPLSCQTRPDCP